MTTAILAVVAAALFLAIAVYYATQASQADKRADKARADADAWLTEIDRLTDELAAARRVA